MQPVDLRVRRHERGQLLKQLARAVAVHETVRGRDARARHRQQVRRVLRREVETLQGEQRQHGLAQEIGAHALEREHVKDAGR